MLLEAVATAVAFWFYRCGGPKEENPEGNRSTSKTPDAGTPATRDAGDVVTPEDAGTPVQQADAGVPDAGEIPDAGVKPEPTPVDRYRPPENPVFPQTSVGVSYFQLLENGTPTTGAYPVGLQCDSAQSRCLFGMGSRAYRFSTEGLATQTAVTLETAADFAPEIDNDAGAFMANVATSGPFFYGLYSAWPSPGITIRGTNGENPGDYFFPEVDGLPMTAPNSILPHGDYLWAGMSNFVWDPNNSFYNPGKVFPLWMNEDGGLTDDSPLTTTQQNPQGMAIWNTGDKEYILLVNTGYADFNNVIHSDSGVDVIDPAAKRIAANIPLGAAAANTLALSPDGSAAFFSSQVLPNIYVVDLERVKTRLATIDPAAETPASLDDVVVADVTNPVAINRESSAFVSGMIYDAPSQSLLLASFNDSTLVQVKAGYTVTRGVGILLNDDFGMVFRQFDCADERTNNCSLVDDIGTGAVALTGQPASGTFVPNASLGE